MQYGMSNAYSELIYVTKDGTDTGEEISSCQESGHDHSFRHSFDDVGSSIDVIPLLVRPQTNRIGAQPRGISS
jgi:hypothetical protein